MWRIALWVPVLALALVGCGAPAPDAPPPTAVSGYLDVPGGRVGYEVVGTAPATPLLVVRGGADLPDDYLAPLRRLADERRVVFYDRLADDGDAERSVDELAAVRATLGLERVLIYGHGSGGALAARYVLERGARGVRGLVLAGPLLDADAWVERLPALDVPVLYISGRDDVVLPEALARLDAATPRSRMVVIDDASHLAMLDRPTVYVRLVRDFLGDHD